MIELPLFESSHLARERAAEAAPGELTLQRCHDCGEYRYPVRELCQYCLSPSWHWCCASRSGIVMATVRVHASMHPFFREHAPWRICSVALEAGPKVIAHACDGAIESGDRVGISDVRVGPTHCVLIANIRT